MISIIIPVYNEIDYLWPCVNSVLRQTYNDFELILIDDGSNNGAENDCDKIAKRDNRVSVIHQNNEGLSAARITGYRHSKGEWIMFMDHDDLISPYMLEILVNNISDDVDIVSGKRLDSENPDSFLWQVCENHKNVIREGREIVEMIPSDRKQEIISTPLWGKLYRKAFLDKIEVEKYKMICPTIFFEDVLMTPIIFSKARKICIVHDVLYIHREIPTSVSRRGGLSSYYYEQIYSGDILLQYANKAGLKNYYNYQLGIYIQSILRISCLIDLYKSGCELKSFKQLIKIKEKKYRRDFYLKGDVSFFKKLVCFIYDINPNMLKFLSRIYFRDIIFNCK